MNELKNLKSLASMAVFSQMHDKYKNVYDIIRAFIVSYLHKNHKYQFLIKEVVDGLNTYFNFVLPTAVVRTALKKTKGITVSNHLYRVDYQELPQNGVFDIEENERDNDKIFEQLICFVEEKKKVTLSDEEKEFVLRCFCSFLLNSSTITIYSEFISAFIVLNNKDKNLQNKLNEIKEGIIIYSGITTDIDLSKLGGWNKKLTIYLDTEILFHIAGLNGEYYLQQAEDLLSLVKEINSKNHLIELKYFQEIKKEIDSFFYAAEQVVTKGKLLSESVAMKKITDNCKTSSDVIIKQTKFFSNLNLLGIREDECNAFYINENFKFNIEDKEYEIEPMLNYINILRKGINSGKLMDIGFIFLTGKSSVLRQAWDENFYNDGDIPRASTLDYMTERFWFVLNKGFGEKQTLKSFDVIYKAKIVMSSILSTGIKNKYEKICKDFTDGELSKENVSEIILNLRKESKLPEEIKPENIDFILNVLDESDIERIQNEAQIKETKLVEAEEQTRKQKTIIENKDELLSEKELKIQQQEEELKKYKEKELVEELEKKIKNEKKQKTIKLIKTIVIVLLAIVCFYLICKFLIPLISDSIWEWISKIGALVGIGGVVVAILKHLWKKKKKGL